MELFFKLYYGILGVISDLLHLLDGKKLLFEIFNDSSKPIVIINISALSDEFIYSIFSIREVTVNLL